MKLYDIAHSRAGDKGNTSTLSLIPYYQEDYAFLSRTVTSEKVKQHLSGLVKGEVIRYDMPNVAAFLFVCHDALDTGVTTSLRSDIHGKGLSYKLLDMEV